MMSAFKNFLIEGLKRRGFFSLFFLSFLTFLLFKILLLQSIVSSLFLVVCGISLPFFIPVQWDKDFYGSSFFQDVVSFLLVWETSFFLSPLFDFSLGFWIFVILTLLNSGNFVFCLLGYALLFFLTFAFKVRRQLLSLEELGREGFISPAIEELENHFTLKFGTPFSFRKFPDKGSRPFYLLGGVRHMWSNLGRKTLKESVGPVGLTALGSTTTYIAYKSDEQVERRNRQAYDFIAESKKRCLAIEGRCIENNALTPKIEQRLSHVNKNLAYVSEYVHSRDFPGARVFLGPVVHKKTYIDFEEQVRTDLNRLDLQSRGHVPKLKQIPCVLEEFQVWDLCWRFPLI